VDSVLLAGNYKQAGISIEENKKQLYARGDGILYCLDRGMTAHYAGDYKTSRELLERGDRAIEAAYTKSVTQNIASFIVNDRTVDYAGEDYENLYLNIFNALNYYHEGNLGDAMVEIRRMEEKLQALKVKYDAWGKKLTDRDRSVKKYTDVSMNFSNSALARYLGMLFYRERGSPDDVRIDFEELKRAFETQREVYNFPAPKSADGELNVPAGRARLNILGFSGLSPVKEEETIRIPLVGSAAVSWIKIALPKMKARPSKTARIELVFTGSAGAGSGDAGGGNADSAGAGGYHAGKYELELLEDMQSVAAETFKKHLGVITAKSAIRGTVKGTSAAVANEVAGNADSAAVAVVAGLSGILLQIFAEASEQADLRLSRYFPAKAYITGITLEPGTYSFSVRYYNGHGALIRSFDFPGVKVRSNALNLIETFSPD